MKTSELVSKLKEIGYYHIERKQPGCNAEYLAISAANGYLIATVSEKYYGVLDTDIYAGYNESQEHNAILRIIVEYAMTPLDERKDTKKYLVKLLPVEEGYLNVDNSLDSYSDELSLSDGNEMGDYQTEFTEKEYNELQNKYPHWLPKFDTDDPRFKEVL
ncbi:hypothetical protein HWC09_gp003 [Lactobacillus phage 3-521]|uniref:Uncharacterized protein n=1 Tax=Lactobacillus phage 3-521 TaxID=2510943 RepID=A0A4Y5FEP2_9CAUD|nr:hypothetical protein HWC09_gp003 [Lactobacillus phage 3-521]QBJ03541.1 hypothetical protein UCC3521_0003 [Lactobacillus phage 3-521]